MEKPKEKTEEIIRGDIKWTLSEDGRWRGRFTEDEKGNDYAIVIADIETSSRSPESNKK